MYMYIYIHTYVYYIPLREIEFTWLIRSVSRPKPKFITGIVKVATNIRNKPPQLYNWDTTAYQRFGAAFLEDGNISLSGGFQLSVWLVQPWERGTLEMCSCILYHWTALLQRVQHIASLPVGVMMIWSKTVRSLKRKQIPQRFHTLYLILLL